MRALLTSVIVCLVVAGGCATGEAIDEGSPGGFGGAAASAGFAGSGGGAGSAGSSGVGGSTGNGGSAGAGVGGSAGAGVGGSAGAGGTSSGGVGGATGGVGGTATGGVGGTATGGAGGSSGCGAGQKFCGGVCIAPVPAVGCGFSDCTPCGAPPANGTGICNGQTCDFTCNSGFVKQGAQCVSTGTGGAGGVGGGTGGSGGGTGCAQTCDPGAGEQQFICTFLCASQGKFGLCAPVLNCCVCTS